MLNIGSFIEALWRLVRGGRVAFMLLFVVCMVAVLLSSCDRGGSDAPRRDDDKHEEDVKAVRMMAAMMRARGMILAVSVRGSGRLTRRGSWLTMVCAIAVRSCRCVLIAVVCLSRFWLMVRVSLSISMILDGV